MSDTAGKQGMAISSQKDLNVTTGNDKNETVAVDEDHSVGSNYSLDGRLERDAPPSRPTSRIDVGNALQVKVTGAQSVSVGGNEQAHAKCDYVEKVGGTRDYTVGGNQITISCGVRQDITGAYTRDVGAVQVERVARLDRRQHARDLRREGRRRHRPARQGRRGRERGRDKNLTSLAAELHMVERRSRRRPRG